MPSLFIPCEKAPCSALNGGQGGPRTSLVAFEGEEKLLLLL